MRFGKKLLILLPVTGLVVFMAGWLPRPAFNVPTNAHVYTSATKTIGTYYTTRVPGFLSGTSSVGASVQSLVLTGLANKGYSHIMVTNGTGASIFLVNTSEVNPYTLQPSVSSNNQLMVPASTIKSWDDISVFDAIYIRSGGSSVTSIGSVDIEVW